MNKPDTLCLAPWTHTYLSPQTERRLCCASREPATSFRQYIDTAAGTGEYQPVTLEAHWNSERMRRVRLQMLAGEAPPECEVCNNKLLNTDVYRDYFNQMFGHRREELLSKTQADGSTPILL
jgi:Iron-sulfur cluster-binding domain